MTFHTQASKMHARGLSPRTRGFMREGGDS